MLAFIIRRIFNSIILLLLVSFITFAVMKMNFTVPELNVSLFGQKFSMQETKVSAGDPLADMRLNPSISKDTIAAEEKRLGLDKKFTQQYFIWLGNILQGDFGYSQNNRRVIDLLKPALWNTLILNILALLMTWAIAVPLGVIAAVKRGTKIDLGLGILSACSMSMPSFVLAIFGLLIALNTGLFPIGGLTSTMFEELNPWQQLIDLARHLALPVIILTILGLASIQRQMRANLLDVLDDSYIRTARAKGLSETTVIVKHAVRNAINPLVTILGYEFSSLFVGSALIEMVLSYPGLGYLTLEAARKLDINIVMANLLIGSVMLLLGNLLADLLLTKVDPRVSLQQIS
jgi:peptide/nickel transport system permease protein